MLQKENIWKILFLYPRFTIYLNVFRIKFCANQNKTLGVPLLYALCYGRELSFSQSLHASSDTNEAMHDYLIQNLYKNVLELASSNGPYAQLGAPSLLGGGGGTLQFYVFIIPLL